MSELLSSFATASSIFEHVRQIGSSVAHVFSIVVGWLNSDAGRLLKGFVLQLAKIVLSLLVLAEQVVRWLIGVL